MAQSEIEELGEGAGAAGGAQTKEQLMAAGNAAFDADDYERALEYYHQATVLDGADAAAWNALAMTYYNMDFPREAWRSYKLALRADAENLQTLWYAGEFLFNMEDYTLSKMLLSHYVELETDPERAAEARALIVEAEELLGEEGESGGSKPGLPATGGEDEEEQDEEELPEGFGYEDEHDEDEGEDDGEAEDESDDEGYGEEEDLEDDDAEVFVAGLGLQLTGTEAKCDSCGTGIPLDAPHCYRCLAPHFYGEI